MAVRSASFAAHLLHRRLQALVPPRTGAHRLHRHRQKEQVEQAQAPVPDQQRHEDEVTAE